MPEASGTDPSGAHAPKKTAAKQPNAFIAWVSALLAPLGIPWAQRIREEIARAKREAAEAMAREAKEQGQQLAEGVKESAEGPSE